jgi:hypothetical protein
MPMYVEYYPKGNEDCYINHGYTKPDSSTLNTNAMLFEYQYEKDGDIMPVIDKNKPVIQYITHSKQGGNNVYNVVFEKLASGSYFKFQNGTLTTSILPTAEPSSSPPSLPVSRSTVSSAPFKPSSIAISYPTLQDIQKAIAEIQAEVDSHQADIDSNFDSVLRNNIKTFGSTVTLPLVRWEVNQLSATKHLIIPKIVGIVIANLNTLMTNTVKQGVQTNTVVDDIINTIGKTINTFPGIPQNIKVPLAQLFSYIIQSGFIKIDM